MRFNEVKRLINEDQDLLEINMSPSNLEKLAAQITGAQAGMEFEMIVPNVATDDNDEFESEPDYDQDERARSFDQIRDFFYDGDFNSRRAVDRLYDNLLENYLDSDFLSEKKREAWEETAEDAIKDLVERDYADDFRAQAEEEILAKTPEFGVNSDELAQEVKERDRELFDAKVDDILANMGSEYDEAYEEWENEQWPDIWNDSDLQEEWLEHEGLDTMMGVSNNYDIEWPYWTQPDSSGGESIEYVADEFSEAIGRRVNWSSSYHGGKRTPDAYVVEPDGSLEPDDRDDAGLEFVSPPLSLEEMFNDLDKVKRWANKTGCYTNDSTGLHINVSVPDLSLDKIDYVKLALLLGDKYVLDQFERSGNSYCKSAMEEVKKRVRERPEDAAALLAQMKTGLGKLATKIIHSGATQKYTSINSKDKYVEFRSPGGDWLNDKFFDKIKPTLLRFVVALDAATDPEKYRAEYLKKLYQVLQPKDKDDTLAYFAKYAAGEMPKAALKSFIKQAQLERKIKKDPTGGQKYWWEVSRPGYFASIQVVASSKEEAIDKALEPDNYPDWASARKTLEAKPIKPYDSSPVKAAVGQPQPIGRQSTQTDEPQEWEMFNMDTGEVHGTFRANGYRAAERHIQQTVSAAGGDPDQFDARPVRTQTPIAGSTQDLQRQRATPGTFTGSWKVLLPDGREVYRFSGVGNSQADANRVAAQWLRDNGMGVSGEGFEVVPIMGEA